MRVHFLKRDRIRLQSRATLENAIPHARQQGRGVGGVKAGNEPAVDESVARDSAERGRLDDLAEYQGAEVVEGDL